MDTGIKRSKPFPKFMIYDDRCVKVVILAINKRGVGFVIEDTRYGNHTSKLRTDWCLDAFRDL